MSSYSEDALVEQPAIALFVELGWETANLYGEWAGGSSSQGRETEHEVVLIPRLRSSLERLNPTLPREALEKAIEELTRDRSNLIPVNANREIYGLLKNGVGVEFQDRRGERVVETVRVLDWRSPGNNDFFLCSQFWVAGEMHRRRCDLVGFVNGLPLVFVELKAGHKNVKNAFDQNLRDYRDAIPQLFLPNGFIILSNGSRTKLGGTYAPWEHFADWKRAEAEEEQGAVSLETAIRGTCAKGKVLDILENFTVFEEARGGLVKKVARNHQYIGVNKALAGLGAEGTDDARLGVFWHTQGSGKSLSMVFFCQKIMRTRPGNWTFLVVTDRDDLDKQIYKNFAATGAVTEGHAKARSAKHLRQLLGEDHRYVFTLIQKFRTEDGEPYPMLSDRSDIIVLTDEAHRSQYDIFAMNMRLALPQASFIGFTGTPLMAGEEKTREVFGDYVSIYNFAQSIEDGATVPLYYENRIPELQLDNEDFNQDMLRIIEEAGLDEDQERALERNLGRRYHILTRDDRLEKVALDLVVHFMTRGYRGKAMVVCLDKLTTIRLFQKVRDKCWPEYLGSLKEELKRAEEHEAAALERRIAEMEALDMAVIVSQSRNEIQDLAAKGVDIRPHRRRMNSENLEEKFKDPDNPLRLVFVCAMWITGFDVPSCSTMYLDKPLKNHTLMQTIARANRVYEGKQSGLIVDYVGVFGKLREALAIYAQPVAGEGGGSPIKDKAELVEGLKARLAELTAFCAKLGIDPRAIREAEGFRKIALLDDAVEAIIQTDETKNSFVQQTALVVRIFKAILPDPAASQFVPDVVLFAKLVEKIQAINPSPDISAVLAEVEQLLDDSIATEGYLIKAAADPEREELIDLSRIDFSKLAEKFEKSRKKTEVEKLRAQIAAKLERLIRWNRSRTDYLEKFNRMIAEYNAGSKNIEELFRELLDLAQSLTREEQRALAEGLTEEELALFDILTQPEPELSPTQELEVKKVVRNLLETLKRERLVLDWKKRQQTRAAVKQAISKILDEGLPDVYDERIYGEKCNLAYRHVFDAYQGQGESIYSSAA